MADQPRFLAGYWGKARPLDGATAAWHPLAYHSLDVAAALEALLDLRPRWLRAIADASGISEPEVRRRLLLAAALHDLGKFAENFQGKVPDLHRSLLPDAFPADDRRGHGEIGWTMWRGLGDPRFLTLDPWLEAAFAHHGAPVPETDHFANAFSQRARADAAEFASALGPLFGLPSRDRIRNRAESWRVAGLMILADWIGSNQQWFGYEPPVHRLDAYWALARSRARAAVGEARLSEVAVAGHLDLATLLGLGAVASPLQAFAERQKPQAEPRLYLVEDLTGAGKTEAALILAHRLIAAGAAEGLYWALPSMATANGLYARLARCYQRLFAAEGPTPSLVLAHSARDLNDGFTASIGRGQTRPYGGEGPEAVTAEAACAAFVVDDRRKTFLAQVGVGTLDQALLTVLPTRHQALRLAALSRRVLVVDEAHSYDAYMTVGLERLLEFHHRLGGSAIVLSATLTCAQRDRLAAIYRGGTPLAAEAGGHFPLATEASRGEVLSTPLAPARGTRRDLPAQRIETPDEAMAALVAAARQGACAVYVRNTVRDALAAYAHLQATAGEGVEVELFHGRFALGDRMARENAVLQRFGRDSTPDERRGRILVATQVVEQSLDLDFDHMATDLCPMDLLIQRAGRLQRHGHRPPRSRAELWVVGPAATEDVAADWYAAAFPHGRFVYADPGVLWRTMSVLTKAGGLNLQSASPRDLIEPVFGEERIDHPPQLDAMAMKAEAQAQAERAIGRLNTLKVDRFDRQAGAWDSDERTPTRLGDETITLRLARWQDGMLSPWCEAETEARAWRLSEIAVRAKRVAETVLPDAAAAAAIVAAQQSWPNRFAPPPVLALQPAAEAGHWNGTWSDHEGRQQAVSYSQERGLEVTDGKSTISP